MKWCSSNWEKGHIWDGTNIALELIAGARINRYIRGINLIRSDRNGYYLYNAHGDVIQLADSVGNIIKSYTYDAFGAETSIDSADSNAAVSFIETISLGVLSTSEKGVLGLRYLKLWYNHLEDCTKFNCQDMT